MTNARSQERSPCAREPARALLPVMPTHREPPLPPPLAYVSAQALRAFVGDIFRAHGLPLAILHDAS